MSLSDYRTRHAQTRTDHDLQAAHGAFPWLMTWDDHEFVNNYADLDIDRPNTPLETVAERRAAAYLAYWEHAPLSRSRKPVGPDMPLFRRVHWGRSATFHVLDTRQYRSNQARAMRGAVRDPESGYCPEQLDSTRGILGAAQRDWLFEGLAGSQASWNVLANQLAFAPNDTVSGAGRSFPIDPWDGYVADRQRVLDFLGEKDLRNVVVITGDAHINSVRNVPPDFRRFDAAPVATEFIGTSITSNRDSGGLDAVYGPTPDNPHIQMIRGGRRGYVIVDAQPERWTTTFRSVNTVTAARVAGFDRDVLRRRAGGSRRAPGLSHGTTPRQTVSSVSRASSRSNARVAAERLHQVVAVHQVQRAGELDRALAAAERVAGLLHPALEERAVGGLDLGVAPGRAVERAQERAVLGEDVDRRGEHVGQPVLARLALQQLGRDVGLDLAPAARARPPGGRRSGGRRPCARGRRRPSRPRR